LFFAKAFQISFHLSISNMTSNFIAKNVIRTNFPDNHTGSLLRPQLPIYSLIP